jgi:hypothetical protein
MKTKEELLKERDEIIKLLNDIKKKGDNYEDYYFIENLMERLKNIEKQLDEIYKRNTSST